MATPFANPRDGILHFRREVPKPLRAAFDGKGQVKVSLGTRDPTEAKAAFARENAAFEERLADARRRLAEGTLLPTPAALVRRWCEGPAIGNGLTGPQRLTLTFIELDGAVGTWSQCVRDGIFPPAGYGVPTNLGWATLLTDKARFEAVITEYYGGDHEQTGTNWIRARWHRAEAHWAFALAGPIARLRGFHESAERFTGDELGKALLEVLDANRTNDEDINRARLSRHRPREVHLRSRPHMRLKQLFAEWQAGNKPRLQTALEYEAAINDFIDFAGDIAVSTIDPDLLYDYRDEAAQMPATMPRADRSLLFRARLAKHSKALPKCAPSTLKKRIGALQALLTYAFQQRWTATNAGVGILVVGYTKTRRTRRSFEDHELAKLCECALFVDPRAWNSTSQIGDATIFWIVLLAITTGARLEEVGQVALADVKLDRDIVYLDIDEYVDDANSEAKSVKTDTSVRLLPVHANLIQLGFIEYCGALAALGHLQLFPDLKENSVGKRTKEASQKINRMIDRYVSVDRRLVFHSLRHAFKAKGNDAGLTDRTLDQICGHAPVSTGGRYGSEPRIRTIHRDLHKIDFSCIGWDKIQRGVADIKWGEVVKSRESPEIPSDS